MNKITLSITLDTATGQIHMTCPVENKIFCLGLMEAAKVCLTAAPAPSEIIPITQSLPSAPRAARS